MPEPLTADQLAGIRARFDTYKQAMTELWAALDNPTDDAYDGAGLHSTLSAANKAANDVPALLAEVDRLRARITELEAINA